MAENEPLDPQGKPETTLGESTAPRAATGALLVDARKQKGMSVADAANALRIRQIYLEAIEQGRLSDLPGAAYALGFVRTYAEYLGLDGNEIVRRFKDEADELGRKTELVFPLPLSEGRFPGRVVILVCVGLALLIYGVWHFTSSRDRSMVELVPPPPAAPKDVTPPAETKSTAVAVPVQPETTAATPPAEPPKAADPAKPAEATAPAASVPVTVPPPASTAAPAPVAQSSASTPAAVSVPAAPAPAAPAPPAPQAKQPPAAPASPVASATKPPPTASAPAAATAPVASDNALKPNPPPPSVAAAAGTASTPQPSASAEAPAGPKVFGDESGRVQLKAKSETWIQVTDENGKVVAMRTLKAGESYRVPNRSGLTLFTGNAGGLDVTVDGKKAPALGPSGMVRRSVSLEPEGLMAGE